LREQDLDRRRLVNFDRGRGGPALLVMLLMSFVTVPAPAWAGCQKWSAVYRWSVWNKPGETRVSLADDGNGSSSVPAFPPQESHFKAGTAQLADVAAAVAALVTVGGGDGGRRVVEATVHCGECPRDVLLVSCDGNEVEYREIRGFPERVRLKAALEHARDSGAASGAPDPNAATEAVWTLRETGRVCVRGPCPTFDAVNVATGAAVPVIGVDLAKLRPLKDEAALKAAIESGRRRVAGRLGRTGPMEDPILEVTRLIDAAR
jgi:hypothetical protein